MIEHFEIENIEQLRAIADVRRLHMMDLLREKPMTVTQLGDELGETPAKVHYHVRELERVGLLKLVETREKSGILEKYYQPVAKDISVQASLLSTPPDEAVAMLSRMFDQMRDGFLGTFREALEHKNQNRLLTLGFLNLYLTSEEHKQLSKRIMELLKPYENRRGIEGEESIFYLMVAHPQRVLPTENSSFVNEASISVQNTSVVGVVGYTRSDLEKILAEGKRLKINVIGICHFATDIDPELADRAIEQIRLIGKIEASQAVREILLKKRV